MDRNGAVGYANQAADELINIRYKLRMFMKLEVLKWFEKNY